MASIFRQAEQALSGDPELEKLRKSRPYKIPKSHPSWDLLSAIAYASVSGDMGDDGTRLHSGLWRVWIASQAPIYCLSNELLRRFQQTDTADLPKLVPGNWRSPLPIYCLALPNNAIQSPQGHQVPYLMVCLHHPGVAQSLPSEHPHQISIAACDSNGTVWVSGRGLGEGVILPSNNQLGKNEADLAEMAWLQELSAIALQSTLALTYLPELIDDSLPEHTQRSKATSPSKSDKYLYPRWIGKNFKRPVSPPSTGHHSSPATHWRRGHWRQQACGQGYEQRKLVWIRPAIVNS
jgi:hypothetical protein